MELAQMIASVDRKSYYSRSLEDIIEAINSGARRLYNWIVKEQKGFFLKWDTTLTLAPNTAEYLLQPDVEQIVRIRELDPGTGRWRIIHAVDLLDVSRMQTQFSSLVTYDEEESPYKFYGPYEKDDHKFYIQIEPNADQNRQLEIVYTAHFVEITDPSDYFMIPEEGRDVVKDFAIAECLASNNDDLGVTIEARAEKKLTEYLTLVRARQIQDTPKQEAYL